MKIIFYFKDVFKSFEEYNNNNNLSWNSAGLT